MKKLIACIMLIAIIFSSACAEDLTPFVAKWNALAASYSSVTLSADMATFDGDQILFSGDTWKLFLTKSGSHYSQAAFYAENMEMLLENAAALGLIVVGEADGFSRFLGDAVVLRLKRKAGKTEGMAAYGSYFFDVTIPASGKGYLLSMVEI